jgi:uncharacterized protein
VIQLPNPLWNRTERRLRAGWRLILHLAVTALVAYAYFGILDLLIDLRVASAGGIGNFIVAQAVSLIFAGLICLRYVDRRPLSELRLNPRVLMDFSAGCVLGGLLMTWLLAVGLAGGWVRIDRWGEVSPSAISQLIRAQLHWFVLMVFIAASEEFFSRGLQMKNLAEGMRPLGTLNSTVLAIFFSSAIFGALHASNPNASWASTVNVTIAGIFLGVSRLASGRLALPIGIHTTWNFFQGPLFGFQVSGIETQGTFMDSVSVGPAWITGGEFGPEAGLLGLFAALIGIFAIAFWRWGLAKGGTGRAVFTDAVRLVRYRATKRL